MVAHTVFHRIGIIGMGRTITIPQIIIIVRVLVLVVNDKSYGCSRRSTFENAGKYLHFIALFPCRYNGRLSGTTTIELMLYKFCIYLDSGRHTVDNPADTQAVRLAESCQTKYISKTIHTYRITFISCILTKIMILCEPHSLVVFIFRRKQ
ncbi:putative uncharacterized protein [Bacteroides sp. CAG:144]|nr:putative uncharacterized protein [Bacteroides sp. CAG:144]